MCKRFVTIKLQFIENFFSFGKNRCQEMKRTYIVIALIMLGIWACKKDTPEEPMLPQQPAEDGVVANLNEMPYPNLSDYRFFTGNLSDQFPNEGVLPYDVITPLFSDYAKKNRYVWMPDGSSAVYVSDDASLSFPDGAVLIKNFYYNNVQPQNETRLIETRLMFRKNGEWEFANYVWNDDQTDAVFDNDGSFLP